MAQVSFIEATKLADLIRTANAGGNMLIRVLDTNQLAVGLDPLNPTKIIDLSAEAVRFVSADALASEPAPRQSRRSGAYDLTVKGKTTSCSSLWDALGEGLRQIETLKPGTIAKLAGVKGRTKRIVGRSPTDLFPDPEKAEKFAVKLMDGWWYGKNNSADETNSWLRRCTELAGLTWDKDVSTSF